MMKRIVLSALAALSLSALVVPAAEAHGFVGIDIGVPVFAPPVVVAPPAPVYVAPAPVYPPRAYYGPSYAVGPYWHGYWGDRRWHDSWNRGHGPWGHDDHGQHGHWH